MLKEMLEYCVKKLVDSPDAVIISENQSDSKSIFEIRVNESDVGKIIGKEGQTIRALRMLIMAIVPMHKEIEITVAK